MKITKAIEVLESQQRDYFSGALIEGHTYTANDIAEAEGLGIEALKLEKAARVGLNPWEYDFLPGETE